jgi:competence protein ComEA
MRTRRSLEHEAAVSRRLAQLGEELSSHRGGVRPARPQSPVSDPTAEPWWDDHTRPATPRGPATLQAAVPRPLPGAPPKAPPMASPGATPRAAPGGRHAGPRPRGLGGFGPAQLAVVAVVVAVALGVTCWWLVRGAAHPSPDLAAAPAPGLVTTPPQAQPVGDVGGVGAEPSSTAAPATVTVDVAGRVRHPGIVVLDAGARVVDALEAARGAKPGVDLTGLNLARVLVDGEQVVVGSAPPAGVAATVTGAPADPSAPAALVNLNTATEAELDTLPEVGPVTATSILTWRDQHGGFTSVDELLEVDGIGEVTLGKLAPYVTV